MGKTLKEMAAEAIAKQNDYDPAKLDLIQGLQVDLRKLVDARVANKVIKEPDPAKMKGLVTELTAIIDKRDASWKKRYDDLKALAQALQGKPVTDPNDKSSIAALRSKCESSSAKYKAFYDALTQLSKYVIQNQKNLATIQQALNVTMLVNKVMQLQQKITDVNNVLKTFKT